MDESKSSGSIANSSQLLGLRVDHIDMQGVNCLIRRSVVERSHAVVSNLNVHACNLAIKDSSLAAFFNGSACVFCDGHGVMLGARILGHRIPEKITYAHWFPLFCDFAAENDISIFLLGSSPGVAEEAKKCLCATRPKLRVVGVHHGYFDKTPGSEENRAVIESINAVKPNVLLVSFGMPLQEKWLADNWDKIDANVALTGGAAIDYMAGVSKRPPQWMTDHGFEWLGRMLHEPRRLWKRYILGNPLFIMRVLREAFVVRVLKRGGN